MRALDTNVLVRLVTGETPEQAEKAAAFVEPGAWVPLAATLECAWVLSATYALTGAELADTIAMLLENDRLLFQDAELIQAAITIFRDKPGIQFADAVILETARRAGHLPLGTFDKKLGTRKGTVRL
jgi:predicted nucleic-acid-binding protein